MNTITIFNSYYFNFLRKLKDIAKPLRDNNVDANIIYKTVKTNYPSYEKSSNEYKNWFTENSNIKELFSKINDTELNYSEMIKLLDSDNIKNSLIYKDVSVDNIRKILNKDQILLHFCAVFLIFSENDYEEEVINDIMNVINNVKKEEDFKQNIEKIKLERVKLLLKYIYLFNEQVSNDANLSIKELEDTSLGKLAKEIMSEINIDEIQSSLNSPDGEGAVDILSSLANPDSGITKLLSTVSQKMISKISSGEINQGDLLQDAMKFSSKLGSSGIMPGLGNMGNMLNMMQKMSGNHGQSGNDSDDDIEMSSLQNIMKNMVENMGNNKQKVGGNNARTETRIDSNKMNRLIKQKQLRKKLEEKKRKNKE